MRFVVFLFHSRARVCGRPGENSKRDFDKGEGGG